MVLNETPLSSNLNTEVSHSAAGFRTQPGGYWQVERGKNLRVFFEDYARSNNLDPRNADTWYRLSWKDVLGLKVLFCCLLLSFLTMIGISFRPGK